MFETASGIIIEIMDKTKVKTVYNTVYWAFFLLLIGTYFAALAFRTFGEVPDWAGAIVMAFAHFPAYLVAARVCRALGISQAGKHIETYVRHDADSPKHEPADKIEYVDDNKAATNFAIGGGILMSLIFGIGTVFWIINPADDKDMVGKGAAPIGLLFAGTLTLLLWIVKDTKYILADAKGVYGAKLPSLQEQMVAWNDINSCEVVTRTDTLGEVASITVVIKDRSNCEQARVFLKFIPEQKRDELLSQLFSNACLKKVH